MLSNASLPTAAEKLTATASITPAPTPPTRAATRPLTAANASAPASISSSRSRRRTRGAIALPAIVPSADMPTAAPNQNVPADCVRNQNARWKNTNPTAARSIIVAAAAICSGVAWSWTRSTCCAGAAATTSGGSRVALASA
jgi:hypothetical protein